MLSSYTLGAIWEKLSANDEHALEILRTLTTLPAPATAELLSGASGITGDTDDVRRILNSLVNVCLVTRRGEVWELHPIVRTYVHESGRVDQTVHLGRAAAAIKVRLRDLIGDERESSVSIVQYGALDPDRANILYVLDWCASEQRWNDAKDIVRGLGYYLHARGLWSDAVRTWEIGAIGAEECRDSVLQSRFVAYLGYMAFFMGNPRRAEFYRDQALRLVDRKSPSYQRGSLFRLTGYLARSSGNINIALADFENGLADMRACENRHGICRLLNDIAETRAIVHQTVEAEAAAQEALSLADVAGEIIERVRAIYILASLARLVGDYERAFSYAVESRDQALECGWWEDAAKASLEIARCSASMRDRKGCQRSAGEAFDYFDRIGSELGRNEATAILADCGGSMAKPMRRS